MGHAWARHMMSDGWVVSPDLFTNDEKVTHCTFSHLQYLLKSVLSAGKSFTEENNLMRN